ncbi:MAG: hypothetical protein MZV64_25495 [Ignavibacteriales bacterium]|nr:hypothetical protein [Ignavibacteriales bacterium]
MDADLQPGTDEMIIALQNKGFELGKDIIWYVDKNAFHSEKAWAERIWRPLLSSLIRSKINNKIISVHSFYCTSDVQ